MCTTGGSGRRQLGGAERILTELVPAHAGTGVKVVAATSDDEVGRSLREAGVPWIGLGATGRVDLGYARAIRRLVREVKPDVVCAHLLSAAMHARAALSLDRTPLVVTLHNSLWQYRDTAGSWQRRAAVQSNITLDLAMRRLRPHATVAVSEFEATELRERGRVRDVHVIPNPLPASWPTPAVEASASDRRPVVGYLGRLEREKGADLLAETAGLLPEMDVRVAGDGSLPIAARPNLDLVGRVTAADFLRRIDCLLVPSRVESFGLSALEALSLGVPVVHTGAGGLAEVTRHATDGLAFRADPTPAALADAVRRALGGGLSTAERQRVAGWYAREYAFDRCVTRWQSLYRSLT
ncbi:glycosyltransferase family 4 protein [Micromonospora sp. WMMA1998]|uniref:glycosyltransferase family 4 protein n=1 Tax=Micromonospora sp. WMMA1998 TaxID=3015167 RepID=UPI00248CF8E5|nr:glycosyltransferase family 4 protein [Micromonospora sp. WMMA1998]WBC14311.1 glycosyltransferase family 4 protein [Micromonospora sp. WMMA1998]